MGMSLVDDRFSTTRLNKGFIVGEGENQRTFKTPYTRYTYESAKKIYDVDVRDSDNNKSYHINMGFTTEPNKYHKAIEEHYEI